MASLKCSKCGFGIHYHDEPDGTEWVAFEMHTWDELCNSPKELSSYEVDTDHGWYSIWKCSECGTIHVFKTMEVYLSDAYEPVETQESAIEVETMKCIAFEDLVWDKITESDETGRAFEGIFKDIPRKYVCVSEAAILVYSDSEFEVLEKRYKKLRKPDESSI